MQHLKVLPSKVWESKIQLTPSEKEDQSIEALRFYQKFALHKELLVGNFVVCKKSDWDMLWQTIGGLHYFARQVTNRVERKQVQQGIKELESVLNKKIHIF